MYKNDEAKQLEIIKTSEELADEILSNKRKLVELDKLRQQTQQAIRQVTNNVDGEQKIWITVGSMLIKMEREKGLNLLREDLNKIQADIDKVYKEQTIFVNKHRNVEFKPEYLGTNLKPLAHKEIDTLKRHLPMMYK